MTPRPSPGEDRDPTPVQPSAGAPLPEPRPTAAASPSAPEPDDALPSAPEPDDASPSAPEPDQQRPPRSPLDRPRIARWIALVGALVVALAARSLVLPHVPDRHVIELRVDSPRDVVGVNVRWSPPGTSDDITTTSLQFSPGGAPSSVLTSVNLPDGAYDVTITVERGSRVDSSRRRITLDDAERITIPLR